MKSLTNLRSMKGYTRRNFVQKSALVSLGAAATGGLALGVGEAEGRLRAMDPELAREIQSYGQACAVKEIGMREALVGSETLAFPAFQVAVEVANPSRCKSLEALSRLGVLVTAEGNTLQFTRKGRFIVIENRVV